MDTLLIVCYIYCFIVGSCIASFLNVVVDRLPRGETFISGRSHCDNCGETIRSYDLIPIVSYIVLRGKCRYCHNKIPPRGFIVEIIGGLLGMFSFYIYQFSINTILIFIMVMVLLTITLIDHDTMTIPDGLIISVMAISVIYAYVNKMNIIDCIIGAMCVSVPMFLLTLLIPDCFGGGDIKLMFASGIALGWMNCLLATFIGILIAGIYAIYLMITKKVTKESHIAFGPYLSLGIFIAMVYGNQIINAYLNLFRI